MGHGAGMLEVQRKRVGVSAHVAKRNLVLATQLLDNGVEARVMAVVDRREEMMLDLVVETAAQEEAQDAMPRGAFRPEILGCHDLVAPEVGGDGVSRVRREVIDLAVDHEEQREYADGNR